MRYVCVTSFQSLYAAYHLWCLHRFQYVLFLRQTQHIIMPKRKEENKLNCKYQLTVLYLQLKKNVCVNMKLTLCLLHETLHLTHRGSGDLASYRRTRPRFRSIVSEHRRLDCVNCYPSIIFCENLPSGPLCMLMSQVARARSWQLPFL